MLSKKERDYLSGKREISNSYTRVIEHRIRKKLEQFFRLEMPMIVQNQSVTEFYNKITEISNSGKRMGNRSDSEGVSWRWGWDLNPYKLALQASA